MQERQLFEYAIIRVVPRVERGECLNVGVIMHSRRHRFLDMKFRIDRDRLAVFGDSLDIDEVERYLQAWDLVVQGKPGGGPIAQLPIAERFRWLAAPRSTILQCSKVHTGICEDPAAKLERLMEAYVG